MLTENEKLTHRVGDLCIMKNYGMEFIFDIDDDDWNALQQIINRLAAYESTNLTPDDIQAHELMFAAYRHICGGKSPEEVQTAFDELQRYRDDEAAGLLVRLPCKAGDTVKVDCRTWGNVWNFQTIENGKFLKGEIVAITKTKKQLLMKIQVKHNILWKRERKRYPISALGKTVFLTEYAARAALDAKGAK
jgi:hypothetical protein